MGAITYQVPEGVKRMTIGVQGEANVREFLFDVTEWRQITGDLGTAEMVVQRRGDSSPYAAAITMHDENTVSWVPTAADTAKDGVGKLQLMWIASGQTVKTKIFDMKVDPALDYDLPDDSLDPWASWMPDVINAAAEIGSIETKVDTRLDSQDAAIAAIRAAVGSPLVANTAAAMTDQNKIYVYTGDESGFTAGNWYYYDGSAWVSGGVYNSAAVETDTTLSVSGVPADAKVTGDEIDSVKSALTRTQNNLGQTNNYIEGYYVARDGSLVSDTGYNTSEYISISNIYPKSFAFWYGTYGGVKTNLVYYDADLNFVSFVGATAGTENRSVSTIPDTAAYCRFSYAKGYDGKLTSSRGYEYWKALDLSVLETEAIGYPPNRRTTDNSGALTTTGLFLEANAIKNPIILFYGKIGTFDSIAIGHGEGVTYSEYISVDNTNLTFYSGTNAAGAVAHGLTIDTYLSVAIVVNTNTDFTVILNTLNGTYTRNMVYPNNWIGYKGNIFAKAGSAGAFTYSNFTFTAPYQKSKWIFGDSYLSNYSRKRWPYYMQYWGFDNALLNGFPGENSKQAYADLMSAFTHGNPKYLVWCLGMNDPDDESVNPEWLNIVQKVRGDCERRGITLILATIPNVPIYDHTYKNAWVKSSGLRYIDFAEAVGATDAGSTWYDGCLETTSPRVHPTEDGARLLCIRAMTDMPELMQP